MSAAPNASYLQQVPLFFYIGLFAFFGQSGQMYLNAVMSEPGQSSDVLQILSFTFFGLLDLLFWGAFWWAVARFTQKKEAAKTAFFFSMGLVALNVLTAAFFKEMPWIFSWLQSLQAVPIGFFCWRAFGPENRKAIYLLMAMAAILFFSQNAMAQGAQSFAEVLQRVGGMMGIRKFGYLTFSSGELGQRRIFILYWVYLLFLYVLKYALLAHWIYRLSNGSSLWRNRRLDLTLDYTPGVATLLFYSFRLLGYCLILGIPATMAFAISRYVPEAYRLSIPVLWYSMATAMLVLFWMAWYLRNFLLVYFIQRGYPRPNASVFFLSLPVLDFLLWPFIALPVAQIEPPEKRLATFRKFQGSAGPTGLKIILLLLNLVLLIVGFQSSSGDNIPFMFIGFLLSAFYLFHPAGLAVFIVAQLLFTAGLLFFVFQKGSNGGEINYLRHIIQGLLTLVYAYIMYGILHPHRMEAELEMEVGDAEEEDATADSLLG